MTGPQQSQSASQSAGRLSRRKFLVGTGAVAATSGVVAIAQHAPSAAQGLGVAPLTPTAIGPAIPPELSKYANDWPAAQANLSATRASAKSPIMSSNVAKLKEAWTFPIKAIGAFGGFTATTVIADGVVYIQDMQSNVFALDQNSGKIVWEKDYKAESEGPNGVAIGYGMVYGSTGNNREAFALDIQTGKEIWRVQLSGNVNEGIDMAPAVYNNVVYISTVPGNGKVFYDGGTKGVLFALDAKTGNVLWQFDTTTDNLWGNPRVNNGGGLWYPPSFDEAGNLYFGTGNPGPWPGTKEYPNGSSRPGPNLYSSCMVSLEPKTGGVRWYYQAAPHDLFDHDFQLSPILATVAINGTPTKLAIGGGKIGTVAAVNADNGTVLWVTKVGEHNENDFLQAVPPGKTVSVLPGATGGVESPMAYADGTVFVPVLNLATSFTDSTIDVSGLDFSHGTGNLIALNAADGSIKWDAKIPTVIVGGATVANDVVFTSGLDGLFRAYSTKDGKELWSYQASAGFNAPPAIAGDIVIAGAAGPLIKPAVAAVATPASAAGVAPTATTKPKPELIAFKLSS